MRHGRFERDRIPALRGERDLPERDGSLSVRGLGALSGEEHVVLAAREHSRGKRRDLFAQRERAPLHGLAGNIRRARGIRAGIVGRGIRIRAENGDILQRTVERLGGDLREDRVAAGAHIGRADGEGVPAAVVQLERRAADVHIADAGALHRHAHADGAHLAVSHIAAGVFFLPADAAAHAFQTRLKRAARVLLPVVGGHRLALAGDVAFSYLKGVDAEARGQLVYGGFHGEEALRRAVAAVRARGHVVGIHNVVHEPVRLGFGVKRDGFMAGEADGRGAVLAVSAGIGERIEIDAAHDAVFVRAETHMHLHFMPRAARDHALAAGKDDHARLFRHPRDERRINGAHRRLLRAEAAADARLAHTDLRARDVQRICHDAARVEYDLRGAYDVQPSVGVDRAECAERFHRRLLTGFRVVHAVDDNVAAPEHGVNVALPVLLVRAEIAAVVRADGALRFPVFLRVNEHGVVERRAEIQHRLKHVVLDLYELHRFVDARLVPPGENGDNVAREADVAVDHEPVERTGLRRGLSGLRITPGVLRHVLPGKHGLHARHAHGAAGVNLAHQRVRVRRAQKLYHEAVFRRDVLGIDRLSGHELHGVQLAHALIYGVHSPASFALFHARKLCMARSCPS